jgi:uncharacterized delta-60 repeat protein
LGDRFRKARRRGRRAAPAAPLFELSPLEQRVLLSFSPSVSGLPAAWEGTNTYSLNLGWTGSGEDVTSWAINWGNGTQTVNTGITNPMSVPHTYPDGPANFTITVTPTTTLRAYPAVSVQPDPTFGTRGKVLHDLHATGQDLAGGMVMQGDKVIVAGTYNNADFALARYNSNGTVDTSFGPNGTGFVTLDIRNANGTSSPDAASAVALTPDGKIVVAGTRNNNDFAVARFTSNGLVDTTFGAGGKVTTDFTAPGTSTEVANAVAVQADGKVVVAGSRTDPSFTGPRFALARYNTDGTLDSNNFGSGGLKTFAFTITSNTNSTGARAVALQADGKIVVGGSATNSVGSITPDFAVARLNTDGSFDSNFGGGSGQVMTDFSSAGVSDSVYALLVQPDQKIVAVGDAMNGNMGIARYTTSGTLDTATFASGQGKAWASAGTHPNAAYAVAIPPDGKLVLAGVAGPLNNTAVGNNFGVLRFTSAGVLDTTFGTGGAFALDIDGRADEARGVAIGAGGYIVVAGSAGTVNTTDQAFAVARLNPSNVLSVQNVAPTLTLSGNATVPVNTSYALTTSATDPGTPETRTWSINYGDGTANTALTTHTYTAIGTYTITATVTDEDGSYAATPLTVSVTDSGWSFRQSGGTVGAAGSVTHTGNVLHLTEGNSLVAALYQNLTIQPSTTVNVTFASPALSTAAPQGAWDAFEIALLDAAGNPIGPVIAGGRDTLFNISEQQGYTVAGNVTYDGNTVSIAIPASVAANTPAKLELRLVNKDGKPGSSVDLSLSGGQRSYRILWGVEEDTGHLTAFWDYKAGPATLVDYGPIRVNGADVGTGIE